VKKENIAKEIAEKEDEEDEKKQEEEEPKAGPSHSKRRTFLFKNKKALLKSKK
jgi:hypothetical protein